MAMQEQASGLVFFAKLKVRKSRRYHDDNAANQHYI